MEEDGIRLSHYDPRWKQEFQQTRSSLLTSCEGWVVEVHHIGSTSISGMIARPIIDCLAILSAHDSLSAHEGPGSPHRASSDDAWSLATTAIEGLNFRCCPAPDWFPTSRQLVKPRAGLATHHVYLCENADPQITRILAWRERMRESLEEAIEFEEKKVAFWKDAGGQLELYLQLKELLY